MKRTLLATVLLAGSMISCPAVFAAETFGIGSVAPSLDIEHWVTPSEKAGEPVTKFSKDNVYIVEFWATWCGPCISSMPHLAEIQEKYRDKNVRIVSISNEDLKTVDAFLQQEGPGGKKFADITSAYSLTTDPDGSVYEAYMDASNQQGIPTAFIVGKDGVVEWIGHPMSMDEAEEGDVLGKIVAGKWDREAFKQEYEEQNRMQTLMQQVGQLAQTNRMAEAVKLVQEELDKSKSPEIKEQLLMLVQNLKLSAGMVDDEVKAYFKGQLESIKGNALEVGRFGYLIYSAIQSGADVGDLSADAIKALEENASDAPEQYKAFLFNQLAQLQEVTGNVDKAIVAQQQAVELTEGQAKKRMLLYLEELKGATEKTEAPVEK